jgi:hypothetical protein
LHLSIGEQFRHIVLEELGEMRRQHGRGINHRIALPAHHEISERFDHMTGVVGAFMPTREHQPRGRKVERQPQHGRDQQHGREG